MRDKGEVLPGITASGVLLILLGGLFGIYVPFYGLMLCIFVIRIHDVHRLLVDKPPLPMLVITIVTAGVLCCICVKAGLSLLRARRWAAFVAMGFGLMLLLFGWDCLRYVYLPYAPGVVHGEDLFAFLTAVPSIGVGLWLCIYLNLPHIRRHLGTAKVAELPPPP